ncbi:MAG: DUF2892 domain-containing protein [Candidatus Moranbacteria bacterium]|nr:DUF2892 domain-containing protein [Candidatus Moranbacteria bacterium]
MKKENRSFGGYRLPLHSWSIERAVFLVAGVFLVSSLCLGIWWNSFFLYFSLFVGVMLIQFSLTGYCPLASILWKFFRLSPLSEKKEE